MPDVSFGNLLVVAAIAFAAPMIVGFFPRIRVPAVVLEIIAGIAVGPHGFGWVEVDLPIQILALIGLAFLLFLAGLEIDLMRLKGRLIRQAGLGFVVTVVLGIAAGVAFHAAGFVKSPLLIGIALMATSLGLVVPVLKDAGQAETELGQLTIAGASVADFGAIVLLTFFFSGEVDRDRASSSCCSAGSLSWRWWRRSLCRGSGGRCASRACSCAFRTRPPRSGCASPCCCSSAFVALAEQPRPGDDPRRVHRRSDPEPGRSRLAVDPSELPLQARSDRLRVPRADLLRQQRPALRSRRAAQQPFRLRPRPAVPARATRRAGVARRPLRVRPRPQGVVALGGWSAAGDVIAVPRHRDRRSASPSGRSRRVTEQPWSRPACSR